MILFSMIVYLGCYTDETHTNGLKALQLDEKSGAMAIVAEYPVSNALYQALSPDGSGYAVCDLGLEVRRQAKSRLWRDQRIAEGTREVLQKNLYIGGYRTLRAEFSEHYFAARLSRSV